MLQLLPSGGDNMNQVNKQVAAQQALKKLKVSQRKVLNGYRSWKCSESDAKNYPINVMLPCHANDQLLHL